MFLTWFFPSKLADGVLLAIVKLQDPSFVAGVVDGRGSDDLMTGLRFGTRLTHSWMLKLWFVSGAVVWSGLEDGL